MNYTLQLTSRHKLEIVNGLAKVYSASAKHSRRELQQFIDVNGYWKVGLWLTDKTLKCYIHRLVAEAVYGPCPEGYEVNHKDGNKLNNHPSNLEYITHAENIQHASNLGFIASGEKHPMFRHGKYAKKKGQNWFNYKRKAS